MVTINPADCKPDEVYEATAHGERWNMQRIDPNSRLAWTGSRHAPHFMDAHDHGWFPDDEVSSLVRLVPAREVTHEDRGELWALIRDELRREYPSATDDDHRTLDVAASAAADAVVAHLNANGGLPADDRSGVDWKVRHDEMKRELGELRESWDRIRRDSDRWRRAHAIVEQERDQAREERDEARKDRDRWKWRHGTVSSTRDCVVVERDVAERERDEAVEASVLFQRDANQWRERAEAAEARTAVTREDAEKAIQSCRIVRPYADDVMYVAVKEVHERLCRAIEAEAEPANQVEELAGQIEAATRETVRKVCVLTGAVAPGLDADEVEGMLDIASESRRIAAHVLGQEAKR